MLFIALVAAATVSQAYIRREQEVDAVGVVDSEAEAAAEADAIALLEEQADAAFPVQFSPYCGKGEHAEYACVKSCLKDTACNGQAQIKAALKTVPGYKVVKDTSADGFVFDDGSICFRPGKGKSYCKKGSNDAAVCHRGLCKSYQDDVPCGEDSEMESCNVKQLAKAKEEELVSECFDDKWCRKRLLDKGGNKFMAALGLTCVKSGESGWGGKRCFYSPAKPCVDKCRDGIACRDGKCPEEEIASAWKVPEDEGGEELEKRTFGEKLGNFGNMLIGRGGGEEAHCQANDQPGRCVKKSKCPGFRKTGGLTDGCSRGLICCGDQPKKCEDGRGRCKPKKDCNNSIGGWLDGCKDSTCCSDGV